MINRDAVIGKRLQSIVLPSTISGEIDLGANDSTRRVLFIYPRTGDPKNPDGPEWAAIPGAKGCTAEACSFRDLVQDFAALGWQIAGCSTQTTSYQKEAAARLHLPYPLLSDSGLRLRDVLDLETFTFEGVELYRRVTVLIEDGRVVELLVADDDPANHVDAVLQVAAQLEGPA